MSLRSSIAGFTVLPVLYGSAKHIIYARRHAGSKKANNTNARESFPEERSLFLVNVPPDATEREIVVLFRYAGTVERVVFDSEGGGVRGGDGEDGGDGDKDEEEDGDSDEGEDEGEGEEGERPPRKKRKVDEPKPPKVVPLPKTSIRTLGQTGRRAHVVFLDASSVERSLNLFSSSSSRKGARPWPRSEDEPIGLARYIAMYDAKRPPLDVVREHVDTYMELYEYELAKTKRKSKYRKGEAIVDEDGFTLVTRGGAYGKTVGGGVGVASRMFQETGETRKDTRKKKEPKEKESFYGFQKTEKQRKELWDLKKKWEDDKARVKELKASKHFKPY